ncbi:phosphoglucosamine mutase [Nodosilinea sp. PGN35]|uniref:phosphoglucosamine mutase n=1 Tax=Nodosilinea sp. PGN35 TaxID=3020489 RepID=UPI0023B2E24E|nr:phosphoglucosamine mutase [Nodosilinea sp. TSF1-S3]MDF0366903.1 phosphoglucosamine mutase [Nodosilinea sp. TSF1-S3]
MVSSPVRPTGTVPVGHQVGNTEIVIEPAAKGFGSRALPPGSLFGTDGIRGKAGDLLTAPLAMEIGYWAGQILQAQGLTDGPIILGQDSRTSGHMLATALSAGLTSAGLDVWHLGLCPTPAVAYLAESCQALGGIMISASHNPPADNGIKFFGGDGTKLASGVQATIEAALRGQATAIAPRSTWGQCYYRPELVNRYASFLHEPLLPGLNLAGMKVVLDMAWGSATRLAEQVFGEAGAEVIALHGAPDGDRINVDCGSTHLEPLKAAVAAHGADLGFAFDGDADRVMAVDAQGRVVDGDYILYIWGQHLQGQGRLPDNTVISTVMANLGFERAWEKLGGTLVRTPVGDQHVHSEMVRRGAMLGGEQSGHILCHHYSLTGDGILTALHLATLVQSLGGSLAALVDHSFQTYPQKLQNVAVVDRDRRLNWQDCAPVGQAVEAAERAMGSAGRVLVRPSGTEPVIRVMVEAIDAALVDRWTQHIVQAVTQHLAV